MQFPKITQVVILQGITGVGLIVGLFAVLIGTLGFNSNSYYHEDRFGIEFGMMTDLETLESYAWIYIPTPMYLKAKVNKISKLDKNGVVEKSDATIVDVFPVTTTTYAGIEVYIELYSIDQTKLPDLEDRNQAIIPMLSIRKTNMLPSIYRYISLLSLFIFNHWTLCNLIALGAGFGAILWGLLIKRHSRRIFMNIGDQEISSKKIVELSLGVFKLTASKSIAAEKHIDLFPNYPEL